MEQNFENFKSRYRLSQAYTKVSCQVKKCVGLISIVLLYYTVLLVLNYYSIGTKHDIEYTYFITALILKILFIILLLNHCRLLYSDNYQLECIYKHHYSDDMVNYSYEQLDSLYSNNIEVDDLLQSKPIFIILAIISVIDFTWVQYLLFQDYTKLQLINYVLILFPCCVLVFIIITLFFIIWKFSRGMDQLPAALVDAVIIGLTRRVTTVQQQESIEPQQAPQDQILVHNRDVPLGEKCAICLEEYNTSDTVNNLPCSQEHHFHVRCLQEWLQNHNSCPICRKRI